MKEEILICIRLYHYCKTSQDFKESGLKLTETDTNGKIKTILGWKNHPLMGSSQPLDINTIDTQGEGLKWDIVQEHNMMRINDKVYPYEYMVLKENDAHYKMFGGVKYWEGLVNVETYLAILNDAIATGEYVLTTATPERWQQYNRFKQNTVYQKRDFAFRFKPKKKVTTFLDSDPAKKLQNFKI